MRRRDWPLLVLFLPTVLAYYENPQRGYEANPIGVPVPVDQAPYLPPRSPIARGYQPPPQPALFEPPRSYYTQQHYQGHGHGHMPSISNLPPRPSTNWARPQRPLDEAAERQLLYEAERRLMTMRTPKSKFNEDEFLMRAVGAQNGAPTPPQSGLPLRQPEPPHRLVYTPKFNPAGPPAASPPRPAPSFSPNFVQQRPVAPPPPEEIEVEPASIDLSSLEKNPPDLENNIIVHIFLNSKEKKPAHAITKIGPIHGVFGIGTAHGGPGTHQNPIVIVKDFDRDRLKFVDEEMAAQMMEEGPANIVEIKAMVSTPDKKIEDTLNRAVNTELDRAIPKVLTRFHGTMTMDTDLRKELEQALVDEIAKNLGDTIDSMSGDVTDEDLEKLIEEGFNAANGISTAAPTTRRITVVTMTSTTEAPTTETPPTTKRIVVTVGTRKPVTMASRRTEAPPTEAPPIEAPETEAPQTEAPPATAPPTMRTRRPTTQRRTQAPPTPRVTEAPPTTEATTEEPQTEEPFEPETTPTPRRTEAPPTFRPMSKKTKAPPTFRPMVEETEPTPSPETPPTERWTEAPPTFQPEIEETEPTTKRPRPQTPPPTRRTEVPPSEHFTESPPTFRPMSKKTKAPPTFRPMVEETEPTPSPETPPTERWTEAPPTFRSSSEETEGTAKPTRRPAPQTRPTPRWTEAPPTFRPVFEETEAPAEETQRPRTQTPPTPRRTEAPPTFRPIFEETERTAPPAHQTPPTFRPIFEETERTAPPAHQTPPTLTEAPPTFRPIFEETEPTQRFTQAPPTRKTTQTPYTSPQGPTVRPETPETPVHIPDLPPSWWIPTSHEAPPTEATPISHEEASHEQMPPEVEAPVAPQTTKTTPTSQTPPPRTFRIKTTPTPTTTRQRPTTAEVTTAETTTEATEAPEEHTTSEYKTGPPETKVSIDFHHEAEGTTHKTVVNLPTVRPSVPETSGEEFHVVTSQPVHVVHLSSHEESEEVTPSREATPTQATPPSTVPSSHEIDEIAPKGACPTTNDPNESRKADVLFLLDSSNKFTEDKFMHAITLILDTVERLKNIGPDGVQVSLVQFNTEPYLEFSLRKHDCKQFLKDDIADTQYMTGGRMLGRALEKVTKFAFTRKRGDRADAENILVILTDGQEEDKVQLPVKVSKDEDVTVFVIGTLEANPEYLKNLAGSQDNVFRLNGTANHRPLAEQLAGKIAKTSDSREKSGEEESVDVVQHRKPVDMNDISSEESTPSPISHQQHTGVVHLECTSEGFKMKLNLPGQFVGHMIVKGHEHDLNCQMAIRPTKSSENRTLDYFVAADSCGVTKVASEHPKGQNSSVIVQLVHAPQLRTEEDRAFLLQCFVGVPDHDEEVSTHLDVVKSEVTVAETISLSSLPPTCNYSIRKDRPDGPVVTKASVGQAVYHRWDCDGGEKANNVYGIKVHSCFASYDVKQKNAIVDINGCSADKALLTNLVYDEDRLSAYALSHVFGATESESLKFSCKLSLCTRDGDGCEGVTPPMCGNNHTDLLVWKKVEAPDEALTSALSTAVDIGKETQFSKVVGAVVDTKIFLALAAAIFFVAILTIVLQRVNQRQPSSPSVSSRASSQFEGSASSSVESQTSGPAPNPRLVEFLKTFDRSRYV